MLKKSIMSMLAGTFSSGTAAAASAPMRSLSAMETAAVAGGPDWEHDPQPFASAIPVPPPAQ